MNADMEPGLDVLDAWHQERGANWRQLEDCRVVADYGDPVAEENTLRTGCGLLDLRWRRALRVTGEDRWRFLNGYLTCDVGSLASGEGTYGFFTTAEGRILADAVVTASDGSLRVEVPAERVEPLIEHLARYILADRVELSVEHDTAQLLLVGQSGSGLLCPLIPVPPNEAWSTVVAVVGDREVEVRRDAWPRLASYSILVSEAEAAATMTALVVSGCHPVGFDPLETVRVEAGVPRFGADFGGEHFPQETGLEDAVSYTKGCYLGQEVVARIHYRGHVNHRLCGLRLDADTVPEAGAAIGFGDQQVGRLGSVAFSRPLNQRIGLAILHRKAGDVGTRVSLEGGGTARVEEPGFSAAATAESVR